MGSTGEDLLQDNRRCNECDGVLPPASEKTKQTIIQHGKMVDNCEKIIAIRREFGITIPEDDWMQLLTFGDAHRYLLARLVPHCSAATNDYVGADIKSADIWTRLCAAIATQTCSDVPANPTREEPFVIP